MTFKIVFTILFALIINACNSQSITFSSLLSVRTVEQTNVSTNFLTSYLSSTNSIFFRSNIQELDANKDTVSLSLINRLVVGFIVDTLYNDTALYIYDDLNEMSLFITFSECLGGKEIRFIFAIDKGNNLTHILTCHSNKMINVDFVVEKAKSNLKYITCNKKEVFDEFGLILGVKIVDLVHFLKGSGSDTKIFDEDIKELHLSNYYLKNMSKSFNW